MSADDNRGDLIQAADEVISDGIDFWANDRPADGTGEPVSGRIQKHEQILEDRKEYRDRYGSSTSNFGDDIPETVKDKDLETFAGAILYLTAAGYKDKKSRSDLIGDRYDQKSEKVADFVLDLNKYSTLDQYSESQITHLIDNEDDDLYRLLQREVTDVRESIQDLNVPRAALENDQEVSFLQRKLKSRQEKMQQAVQQYVAEKSLYDILKDLEEAILKTGQAAQTREEITDTIESEIADLEEQLQWALRNQREVFTTEVETIAAELEAELLSTAELETHLGDLEEELQWAFREHREFLASELEKRTGDDIESLTPEDVTALLHEQRDDIVESLEDTLADSQSEIRQKLTELRSKQDKLDKTIADVQRSRDKVSQEEIETIIDGELADLTEQRDKLNTLIDRFERERSRLEAEVNSLQQSPTPPEPVTTEDDAVEGTEVIPASVARLYEQDFIARIERSIRDVSELTLPDGDTMKVSPDYWEANSRSERGSFQGTLFSKLPDDAEFRRYPERPWVRYATVESAGFFGHAEETDLVIEGLAITRLGTFADHASDWAPAMLPELHGIVGEALDRGLARGQEDAHHLLVIGSPTGWSRRVIDEVVSGSLFDADVSICLVDLRTDERYYHDGDSVLRDNQWVFTHELPTEDVEECVSDIEQVFGQDPSCERILLEEVVTELDYSPHIVKRAFDRLEDRGIGKQIETDHGLLLVFDSK